MHIGLRVPAFTYDGGAEQKKTLRLVAGYAGACGLFASPEPPRKLEVLREHCAREGRRHEEIKKAAPAVPGPHASVAETVGQVGEPGEQGIDHVIFSAPDAPKVIDLLARVREQVDRAAGQPVRVTSAGCAAGRASG